MIPHGHPRKKRMAELVRDLPLKVQIFRDEQELYLCVLERAADTESD